jgi:integrase/recombinase XerC
MSTFPPPAAQLAKSSADNQTQLDAYLDCLRSQRHLSPHTLLGYRSDLDELLGLMQSHALPSSALFKPAVDNDTQFVPNALVEPATPLLINVTHAQVRRFATQLHARGLNPRSIARKLSAWRGFFDWLSESTELPVNPVDGVKAPKRHQPLPKALSVDDAVRLVATPSAESTTKHSRSSDADQNFREQADRLCNQAMFELLYSSGLRVSELVSLDYHYAQQQGAASAGWIDFAAHEVTVTGKGNKMRNVPVGQAAMTAILEWVAIRTTLANADTNALFVTRRGARITPRMVQVRIKAHAQAIGIPVDVHPHVLRHSFASHMLQSCGDLRAVQEMLGHSSITSTQIYTSLDFQRLAQVYDAAHPRAQKKN